MSPNGDHLPGLQGLAVLSLASALVDAVMDCPVYRVRVLLPSGSRITYQLPAPHGCAAIDDALDLFPGATSVSAICIKETCHASPH